MSTVPIPHHMRHLPLDTVGRPIPWFTPIIDGKPDFRLGDQKRLVDAVKMRLCWICGGHLGAHLAFTIGPMCAVNRISSEPPGHRDCAVYSARACPFLSNPDKRRRGGHMPEEAADEAAGMMIERNPGVVLVWVTKSWRLIRVPAGIPGAGEGVLFEIGRPTATEWYCRGRRATRDEVLLAFRTGVPTLRGQAEIDGPQAVRVFHRQLEEALSLVPA